MIFRISLTFDYKIVLFLFYVHSSPAPRTPRKTYLPEDGITTRGARVYANSSLHTFTFGSPDLTFHFSHSGKIHCLSGLSKSPFCTDGRAGNMRTICERASFASRKRPYQRPKCTISAREMGHIRVRNGPFRKTCERASESVVP